MSVSKDFNVEEFDFGEAGEDIDSGGGSSSHGDGSNEDDSDGFDENGINDESGIDDSTDNEEEDGQSLSDHGPKRKIREQDGPPVKSMKSSRKSEFYKPPTVEELNRLRETQTLYHSNLFRLQMEELFTEVNLKAKLKVQLEDWMNQFKNFAQTLQSSKEYEINDRSWMKDKNVEFPVNIQLPDFKKGIFSFVPPTDIQIIGSFGSNTITMNTTLDVMITMPVECLQASDYQNGLWIIKRALYLSWLSAELKQILELATQVEWILHGGLDLRPVLQVTPPGKLGKKWKINIFPVPPTNYFNVSRFSPTKNCIRPSWFFSKEKTDCALPPTPHYNWLCNMDVLMAEHNKTLKEVFQHSPNLSHGLKLIKIWLTQRQQNHVLLGHTMSLLILHLLRTHKINSQMSAYQVFRTTVLSISTTDWTKSGPSMCTDQAMKAQVSEEMHQCYPVVFVDATGHFNIAAHMNKERFLHLQHEAKMALTILGTSATTSFEALFIHKVDFIQAFDQLVQVKLKPSKMKKLFKGTSDERETMELSYLGNLTPVVQSQVLTTLTEALGDRITLLTVKPHVTSSWPVDSLPPARLSTFTLGLLLHPTSADALLTKGPTADETEESKKFRSFWGDKSNLRRFQDGSFHEAVLWGDLKDKTDVRRLIPGQVINYILQNQFGLNHTNVTYIAGQTEKLLQYPYMDNKLCGTGEEETSQAIVSFDLLSQKLRSLDLPLKVASVQSTSEVIRHAQVFPPNIVPSYNNNKVNKKNPKEVVDDGSCFVKVNGKGVVPRHKDVIDVVVFLEMSGKWPDDLAAIKSVKTEFHTKIADQLNQDGHFSVVFPEYLQVCLKEYVYRIKVCYRREIYLCRLVEVKPGEWQEQDTPEAIALEKQIEILPRITTALASLRSDHPCYNGAVRLCKRWACSQLLSPHLPPLAVELLVAHLFINPAPHSAPNTPHLTLIRFLYLLATTEWKSTPIILNFNHTFSVEDETELHKRFGSQRDHFPALMIATPYELRGPEYNSQMTAIELDKRFKLVSTWTRSSPSQQMLYRAKQTAKAALTLMMNNLFDNSFDFKSIFRPSYSDYDVLIELHVNSISHREELVDWPKKRKAPKEGATQPKIKKMPIVLYEPVDCYLRELRESYGHFALFFHDEQGGNTIGVVWLPQASTPKDVKVTQLEGHQLIGVKNIQQVGNLEAIVEDFSILGENLVKSVIVSSK